MKNLTLFRWLSCVLAAFVFLFTGIVVSAHAATIAVTTTADELADPGPGAGCSLREAIQSVNVGVNFGGCTNSGGNYGTGDTISIPAGTYIIAIAGADELLNATGSFDILNGVSMVGAGAGSTTIDGGGLDRVFFINGPYTVSFSGVTITNGASGGGSGIYNGGGTLTILNSDISNNTASGGQSCGGGIAAGVGNPVTITNSTISGNSAGYCGGGILVWGSLTVANSTISGNSAGSWGGGVFRGASGTGASTFTNSTISGNSGPNGGGIRNDSSRSVTLSNTIVANQTSGADCGGPITSSVSGHNLESATSCGFTGTGDLQNTDPLLVALASNGGPTRTMALAVGSPAIDAGDNAVCAAPPVNGVDQRGATRPQGSACDIGAYEYFLPNTFDVDGNGRVDAVTDGLILIRYMFGLRGTALTAGAIGTGATRTAAQIETYIQSVIP